jgi:hypothetical protein
MLTADVAYNTIYIYIYYFLYLHVCTVFVSIIIIIDYWNSVCLTLDCLLGDNPNFISMQDVPEHLLLATITKEE